MRPFFKSGLSIAAAFAVLAFATPVFAQEEPPTPPRQNWSFAGPFGTFDRAAAQRGYQVYHDVCSRCHSLKEAYYRDLAGIGLNDAQITATAASVTVPTTDDSGAPADRPALPSDHFKEPFPNEKAARAALNGALPPDLSVIEKARAGGADYIYAVLTGFSDPPATMKMGAGMNYNKYFPGNQIAMPPPLVDGAVTYADGTPATVQQMAFDVSTFLTYISEPEMEQRKRMGVKIVLFLVFMTCVTYLVKRKVWADVDH